MDNNYYSIPQGERMPEQIYQQKNNIKTKKDKKPVTMGRLVAVCMVFMMITVLVNAGIMMGAYMLVKDDLIAESETANKDVQIGTTLDNVEVVDSKVTLQTGDTITVSDIVKLVMPSVVAITNTSIVDSSYNPFYGGGQYQVQGAGSGIIIGKNDEELLIVTNNHVVEDSVELAVTFVNDKVIEEAYVKGTSSKNDLAIVGIKLKDMDSDTLNAVKIATLGSSNDLEVGDGVVAIGNALGYGQSVTVGYVSAMNRTITIDGNDMVVIQTDAAINGGNSGGALINMKGEVIGINVAKSSSSSSSSSSVEGMGYAIPISGATDIINKLMNIENKEQYSEAERGYLGVTTITVDATTANVYSIPMGAYVRSVAEGSPAEIGGITAGSVIVKINGYGISTADELINELAYFKPGDEIVLTVSLPQGREYVEKDLEIILGNKDIFGDE
jgi:serine protease Do